MADKTENIRFRYQEDGLNLRRISYLPYEGIRAELRMLSFASRISMCALVVLMLEWERESHCQEKEGDEVTISFESGWCLAGTVLTVFAKIRSRTDPPP